MAYKSKKLYREAVDKFQGKMYASYFDRIQRKTYYIRNKALVEQALLEIEHQEGISKQEVVTILGAHYMD